MTIPFHHLTKAFARQMRKAPPIAPSTLRPGHPPVPIPKSISQELKKASAALTRVRVIEGLLATLLVLLGGLLASCFVDWLIHTPRPVRIGFFVAQMLGAIGVFYWRVLRPMSHTPSDREVALLVQKKFPALGSTLISVIELACGHGRSIVGSRALIERLGAETPPLLRRVDTSQIASPNQIVRLLKFAVMLAAVNAVWISLLWPASLHWLARWTGRDVPPPTQTLVRDLTGDLVVQRGTEVELQARAEGVIPRSGRVRLEFADGTTSELPAQPMPADKTKFSALVVSVQNPFQYSFRLNDGIGASHRVQVVLAPAIESFTIRETFPAYTGLPPKDHATGSLNFLVGSTLEITVTATQDLKSAKGRLARTESEFPLLIAPKSPRSASGAILVPPGLSGLSFPLINAGGVASSGDTVFRATSIDDKPPDLALLGELPTRQTQTTETSLELLFTCTDDFGLSRLALRYAILDSDAQNQPPDESLVDIALPIPEKGKGSFSWKPGQLPGASPGKTVVFFLEATDNRAMDGSANSGISRTDPLSISIVTPEEKKLETLARIQEAAQQIRDLGDRELKARDQLKKMIESPKEKP